MRRIANFLFIFTMLAAITAQADIPRKSIYVGVYGGEHLPADGWKLGDLEDPANGNAIKESAVWGLRVGGFVYSWLGFEANVGYLPATTVEPRQQVSVVDFGGSVVLQAADGRMGWYALLGGGGFAGTGDLIGGDIDAHIHSAVGVKAQIFDAGVLRLQGRLLLSDDIFGDPDLSAMLTLGLDVFVWRTPDDRDQDGIVDDEDSCPTVKGVASARGCPDKDGDGFADASDKCPATAGVASAGGCPDQDGDAIQDKDDKCPAIAGPKEHGGCPDKDGDGVIDKDDKCPDVAGKKELQGCPDKDGDGIADGSDACPDAAGPERTKGCPDKDGDGIADKDDDCPAIAGIAKLKGCLPKEVAEKFAGALEGIYFKTGSAKIKKRSFKVLNDAVRILKEWPSVRVGIHGHTDNEGGDEANLKLSDDRAASVRQYLVDQGIAADRVESKGFGESKPVADNKTRKGRAQNRRIEFRVITR